MLALLCLTAAGAWAQTEQTVDVTPVTGQTNQWTLAMPAGNVVLHVEYEPELTATFKAANALTIEAGKATVSVTENGQPVNTATLADGKLSPLYQGQTVILKASEGYKFRKVEVKKDPGLKTLTVKGKQLKYVEGDTWQQAIERPENEGSGWRVQGNYILNGELTLMIGSGYVRPEHTIDATKNYSLEAD